MRKILFLVLFLLSGTCWSSDVFVSGEYLVQIRSEFRAFSLALVSTEIDLEEVSRDLGVYKVKGKLKGLREKFVAGAVEAIEPNYLYYPQKAPNDPEFGKQWGLSGPFGVSAPEAWDLTVGGSEVTVAVVDTGVDYSHPDLRENMWENEAEKNGAPGVDDDGNGLVDDLYGYDFANSDADPADDMGHGTHCAGIIGARGNNGVGIAGVNWTTRIMALKFMNPNTGGKLEHSLKALEYAAKKGARVINASWGGGMRSVIMENLLKEMRDKGILFVAAAGNSGRNTDYNAQYPAGYDVENVISVGASDENGELAVFSNYGTRSVDIAAPGLRVLSTLPEGKYGLLSGTSMAAPFVTGLAALTLSREPGLTLSELKTRILKRGYRTKYMKKMVATGSLLNAPGALTNERPAPEPDADDPEQWAFEEVRFSTGHSYKNNDRQEFVVERKGANRIAVYFRKLETEEGFDVVRFFDRGGKLVGAASGSGTEFFSKPFPGDFVRIVFESDDENPSYGFDIERVAYE